MTQHVRLAEYASAQGKDPAVRLAREDRRRHCYVVGKSGLGKTTLLHNILVQDVRNGDGLALIDPHGDEAEWFLDHIPSERMGDVVYFNPADRKHPAGFNLLRSTAPEEHHLVVSSVISAFKHLWHDSWGPRMEYVLANALAALLDNGNSTLLGVLRLLSDESYRDQVVQRVRDPLVRAFWLKEFASYDPRFRSEVIAPIQNKLGRLLLSRELRNILGQVTNTIDIDRIMNERKILVVNLAKGRLGEDKSNFLGSLLISQIHLAAMRRASIPEEERVDFFCAIDEFQNFGTDSFSSILSESRKYRLSLLLIHQYLDQLPPELRHAVFGNVGTLISFGVGGRDARHLETEFRLPERNFVELDKYQIWVRLLQEGLVSAPFLAQTYPPFEDAFTGSKEKLVRQSRTLHARKRHAVEDKINRWLGAA